MSDDTPTPGGSPAAPDDERGESRSDETAADGATADGATADGATAENPSDDRVGTDDPSVIEYLVVSRTDLVAAIEARDRNRRPAVLRVTPPFTARMRARLHVAGREADYDDPAPIHIEPRRLVDDVPSFPGRGPDAWRDRVRTAVRDTVEIQTASGATETRITLLG